MPKAKTFTKEVQETAGRYYFDKYGELPADGFAARKLRRLAATGDERAAELLRRFDDDGCYMSTATVLADYGSWGAFRVACGVAADNPASKVARLNELVGG